ncbi:MAG: type II toxin-antitoxin system RelE/ParE family toxin [Alphaproteobacteria bacterium]|nr:type II toxin-antitoxin system RelE/ParE family toxin [Alphaproteobacteria bacterium]
MSWSFVFLNAAVRDELEACTPGTRASFERIVGLARAHGLERVREPYIKHLEGRLWEMRLRGREGIVRAIYATAPGRRVVILRVFAKKTQKTPRREIALAHSRLKEI